MAGSPNLKKRNMWKVSAFVALNIAAFWTALTTGVWEVASIGDVVSNVGVQEGVIGIGLPVLATVLNALMSADAKSRLVFLRLENPLPGSRAFTDLAHRDPRIDPDVLTDRYGVLPMAPVLQNRLWYRIFKKHEHRPSVMGAHENYLFLRDLTAMSTLFMFGFGGTVLVSGTGVEAIGYTLALALQWTLLRRAAATTGAGFVTTVLAEDTARKE